MVGNVASYVVPAACRACAVVCAASSPYLCCTVAVACPPPRAVIFFEWVFFLISLGGQAPHVRPMGRTCGEPNEIELTVGIFLDFVRLTTRTCGGPNEIELTAIGVELNGSGRGPGCSPPHQSSPPPTQQSSAVQLQVSRHDRSPPFSKKQLIASNASSMASSASWKLATTDRSLPP